MALTDELIGRKLANVGLLLRVHQVHLNLLRSLLLLLLLLLLLHLLLLLQLLLLHLLLLLLWSHLVDDHLLLPNLAIRVQKSSVKLGKNRFVFRFRRTPTP